MSGADMRAAPISARRKLDLCPRSQIGGANMIQHIVFDIGNVFLRYDPEAPFRDLIPDKATRQWFMTEVCSQAWNLEQDRGRSWEDAEAVLIKAHPQHEDWIRAFRREWHKMVAERVPGSAEILAAVLDQGWDVTMLTNFNQDTFQEAQAMYPELASSRGVTVSGVVRLVKPDPAIYRLHAETFGLQPTSTLFFDDTAQNVAAAKACGWQARLFVDAPTMRHDLAAAGVNV